MNRFAALFGSLVMTLSLVIPCAAASENGPSCTIKEIVEAMRAAESRFTDIRFDYTDDLPAADTAGNPARRVLMSCTFARKMPEGWCYLDRKGAVYSDSPAPIEQMGRDLTVFDGRATLHLYEEMGAGRQGRRTRALILPGRDVELARNLDGNAYDHVWGLTGPRTRYVTIIQDSNDFRIVSPPEEMNGYRTIKLAGTSRDKVLAMTLWVCPDLNFLPIRAQGQIVASDGKTLNMTRSLSDFVRLPNGLFYPQKVMIGDPNIGSNWRVITVRNISIDPIPESFFHPPLPRGAHVTDHISGASYTMGRAAFLGLIAAGIAVVCIGGIVFEIVNLRAKQRGK